jgi:hypothetical protein
METTLTPRPEPESLDAAARTDDEHVEWSVRVSEYVPPASYCTPVGGPDEYRNVLSGQEQRGGSVGVDGCLPRPDCLIGVGGPEDVEAWDGP